MKNLIYIFIPLIIFSINCYSQDCSRFDKWEDCRPKIKKYDVYLQPKSVPVSLNDTVLINIVFEGNRDYVISFCANKLYYPIHIRLMKLDTKEIIYDNANDDYIESIGVGFYNTQSLIIELSLLADRLGDNKVLSSEIACVGLIMQWKKIFRKI